MGDSSLHRLLREQTVRNRNIASLHWWQGLYFRVLIVLGILLGMAFGASWYIAINLTKSTFFEFTHERFHERFDDINTQILFLSEVSLLWTNNMAAQTSPTVFQNSADLEPFFEKLQNSTRADVAILVTPDGKVLGSSQNFFPVGDNLSSWSIVQKGIVELGSDVFVTSLYNQFFLFSGSPVLDEAQELKGILILGYSLNRQFLSNMKGRRDDQITLIRRRAVMSTTFGSSLKNLPLNYLEYQKLLVDQLTFKTLNIEGESYLVDGSPIPLMAQGVPGSVLLAVPIKALGLKLQQINRNFSRLFIVSFLVLGVVIGVFLRFKLKPIHELIKATEKVAQGDLNLSVTTSDSDELGLLAEHFNFMVEKLAEINEELNQHQQNLEETIAQRTSDLAQTNQRLGLANAYLEEAQTVATMGHWIFNQEEKKLQVSATFSAMLGLTPEAQTLDSEEFLARVNPEHREIAERLLWPTVGSSASEGTYLLPFPDKAPLYLSSRSRMVMIEGEHHALGSVLDVTSSTRRAQELQQAREDAEGANRLKDKLLSLLVHDLKGPIGSVMGSLSLLSDELQGQLSTRHLKLFQLNHQSLSTLIDLIHDLLELQKIKQGQIILNLEPSNLHFLVEQIKRQLSGLLEAKQLTLENRLPDEVHQKVDLTYIQDVLQNLLTNAIKFSHKGGVIQCISGPEPGSVVVVDQGVGMTALQQKTVFQMGENVSTFGTLGETGSGLGLPLSYEIMQAHGGELSVESREDQGSRFTLTFAS